MEQLEELYQTVILDHSRKPRNKGPLEGATHFAAGNNPSCGDEVSVQMRMETQHIEDVRFQGQGCAISQASASLMTLKLRGKSVPEARLLTEKFHSLVVEGAQVPADGPALGDLQVFEGVRKFPQRVKCATLAWNAAREILAGAES